MKAVSAYTCEHPSGKTFVVVDDSGRNSPFDMSLIGYFAKGDDMSNYGSWPEWPLTDLTNIQPVELPEPKQ